MKYKQNVRTGRVLERAEDLFYAGLIYGILSIACFAAGSELFGGFFFGALIVAWAAAYLTRGLVVKTDD